MSITEAPVDTVIENDQEQDFWTQVYIAAVGTARADAVHCAFIADAALQEFRKRVPT